MFTKLKRRLSKDCTREQDSSSNKSCCFSTVLALEDVLFHITTYLSNRQDSEMLGRLVRVSRTWHRAFSIVRAQMRWHCIMEQLPLDQSQWIYHKLLYIRGHAGNGVAEGRSIPAEGCLRIFCSNVNGACQGAMRDYTTNRRNDEHGDDQRIDSRPDYYYRAHREAPICIELVPPKALTFTEDGDLSILNEIEYDQKPRLISKYHGNIDDINRMKNSPGSEESKEGIIDLGYHEILNVRNSQNARLNPRPPLDGKGQDSTDYLKACNAKALMLRWVKFAHVVGEDRCRMFVHKSLLPMIGSRPTGQSLEYIAD